MLAWLSVSCVLAWLSVSCVLAWLSVSCVLAWLSVSCVLAWLSVSCVLAWLSVSCVLAWLSVSSTRSRREVHLEHYYCTVSVLFPISGLQHSEGLACLSDSSHGIFCKVSICCDFTSQVCKILNVFQSITVGYVVYGDGVICLVVDPHQFGFCCVEL